MDEAERCHKLAYIAYGRLMAQGTAATGKIVPYIFIGLIQSTIILFASRYLFHIPIAGSLVALYVVILLFVAANLTVGITLSSMAQNQLQAMQLTFFYFLPGMLLSGFMFPFRGMPAWAQAVGSVVPMTYFTAGSAAFF